MVRLIYLITAIVVSTITTMVYGKTETAKITITRTVVSKKNEAFSNTITHLQSCIYHSRSGDQMPGHDQQAGFNG